MNIDVSAMHSIRVNNVDANQMTDEAVFFYFGNFGKIGDINRPIDLKTRKYRPFIFVRFIRIQDALDAAKNMNHTYLFQKLVTVEFVKKVTYFGQDETTLDPIGMSGFG